jgi:hypothetical protein
MTKQQRRIRKAVAYLQNYMKTYAEMPNYDIRTPDKVLIDDVLYGLGVALDPKKYEFAPGYDAFKDVLRKHLAKS